MLAGHSAAATAGHTAGPATTPAWRCIQSVGVCSLQEPCTSASPCVLSLAIPRLRLCCKTRETHLSIDNKGPKPGANTYTHTHTCCAHGASSRCCLGRQERMAAQWHGSIRDLQYARPWLRLLLAGLVAPLGHQAASQAYKQAAGGASTQPPSALPPPLLNRRRRRRARKRALLPLPTRWSCTEEKACSSSDC